MQVATGIKAVLTNKYNTFKYNKSKYRSSYYVRMRFPFQMISRRGRDDLHSATVKQIASSTPYPWRRKHAGNPSAAQLWVRNTFCKGAACFREQPQTGGWDGVSPGPRGRDWWYDLSLGTGLYYYPNFMSNTLLPLFQTTTPEWCTGFTVTSVVPNKSCNKYDTYIDIYGTGFSGIPTKVTISATECKDLGRIDGGHIFATVPSGISAGVYDLKVNDPVGGDFTLNGAFTVYDTGCHAITTYEVVGGSPEGLHVQGGLIHVAPTGKFIHIYNTIGALIEKKEIKIAGYYDSLTIEGSQYWLGAEDWWHLVRIDNEGNQTGLINLSGEKGVNSIFYDGQHIWYTRGQESAAGRVYKIDLNGVGIDEWPAYISAAGITRVGDYVYVLHPYMGKLSKYTLTGTLIGRCDFPFADPEPLSGLGYGNGVFWSDFPAGNTLYKFICCL